MIKRRGYKQVVKTVDDNQIPIVIGLRRIGKTTMLKQLKEEYDNSYYLSFDDFSIIYLTDSELGAYLETLSKKYDMLLLDEVQVRSKWDLILKNLYDKFLAEGECKYIVTGSSSINLLGREMGVNRTKRIYLDTGDFDEYLELTKKEKTFENFESFLGRGLPDYMSTNKNFDEILNEMLKPILNNDIPRAYPQTNLPGLNRLLLELSYLTNGEVNESALAQKTLLARDTIRSYLEILENALLIKSVYKLDERLVLPKKKTRKVYINPHVHIGLLKKSFNQLDTKYKGHIIESYWLHGAKSINGGSKDFYYFKDRNTKQEIDFISLNPDGSIKTVHEFKYSLSPSFNKNFITVKSTNKVLGCKETKDEGNHKKISILDVNNN